MSDACGCGHDEPRVEGEEDHEPDKWWQVTEIRAAAVAGLLLVAALVVGWTDGPHPVKLTLEALALIVAGYTFVPSTLTRLARGKIGVGTLMTIAAVGAVLLGEVGEAAMLAFLFAISEGLEEYAVTRTRRGLRALLNLVPDTATVLRGGREQTVAPAELVLGEIMIVKPGSGSPPTAPSAPAAPPWTPPRSPANPSRSRPHRAPRCSPARSTAPAFSRSRSPPVRRTTRWPRSCGSSRPSSPARARPSVWPTRSPSLWFRG